MKIFLLLTFIATVLAGGTFKSPICVELDEPLTVTSEGTSRIIVQGQVTGEHFFHLYLVDGWGDVCAFPSNKYSNVALVIVARISQKHIAANHYVNDTSGCISHCATGWSTEVHKIDTPLAIGTPFEIVIACETSYFQVFLNGKLLLSYNYYIKIEKVTHMRLLGSASFRKIDIVRPVWESNCGSTNVACELK